MSQMAPGEQQAREFSAHLSLFFSPCAYLLMTRGEPTIASLFCSRRAGDSEHFGGRHVPSPTQPARHPVAKGTAAISAAIWK